MDFMNCLQIVWNIRDLDWVSTVRHCKMGLHKSMILKQVERRPEFQSTAPDDSTHATSHMGDRPLHLNKMVDEIKALMMA